MGFHSQVDIRDHLIVGGHKPIEQPLIDRVTDTLVEAVRMRDRHRHHFTSHQHYSQQHKNINQHKEYVEEIKVLSKPGDFVTSYANDLESLHHILGPKNSEVKGICRKMIFARVRQQLAADEEGHCNDCADIT
jgi:2-phosphoglycerate kinase